MSKIIRSEQYCAVNPISVSCLVLFHEGKILAAQRGTSMDLAGYWEFPGGKMESGESPENCLHREIKEELGIEIQILKRLRPVLHSYPNKEIQLIPFLATWRSGSITLLEHTQFQWLDRRDLLAFPWAPADVPIVKEVEAKWEKIAR